jgi:2-amino-4-hydroxy-6-hydroxymethyldihydropteridine diphosphokinase
LLKTIESKLGRIETVRNGPRPIDLDILLYDQLKLQTPQLTIPHPRMLERDFVMNPLNEIDPQLTRELTHARH